MADQPGRDLLASVSRLLGRFRGFFVPIGLFAVVAVGIHAGSDRVDDHAFVFYNRLDAIGDGIFAWLIRSLGELFGVGEKMLDRWVFGAIALIDVERKEWLARFTALVVELSADLILAVPVFVTRRESHPISRVVAHMRSDPTLLRFVAPLCAALACIAGVLHVAREIQVLSYASLGRMPGASQLASAAGLFALFVVSLRLGAPVVIAAMRWADLQAEQDVMENKSTRARRMRGWLTAIIALPVTILALAEPGPVLGTLRALFPG